MRTAVVRLPDGTSLPYAQQGAPSGLPVVLLHAVGESWRSWGRLLPHLPGDLRVVAPTLRGHGEADKPAAGYRLADAAADVVALLDALDLGSVLLAGTSSGGLVAQQVAVDHPRRVRGLLLVGSPRGLRDVPVPAWVHDATALTDPVPESFARSAVESFPVRRALPPDFVEQMVEDARAVPAHVWREVMAGLVGAAPPTEVGPITAPTVALWGDRDEVLARDDQERLVGAVRGARLVVYGGTGHLVLWEEPERVAAELVALARTIPSG